MPIAIKAENISKAYQLGEIGTGTLSRDLERWVSRIRGKEDPFLKIGEANDRTTKGTSKVVWSLKDINFEIEQGDAVGIIGRNGAGKSTLLKILSRVTSPTTGRIIGKGRIASLLEVGTGFHPELTGRENIFLNGAILGMRKQEIVQKFDEIVDFAGVERYVDTPVKRYSSGMYVRLAFAVAACLDQEILVIDEVLAVGDAEFQKKAISKMKSISAQEGRTILFVSHNMAAIQSLCNNGIYLKNGLLEDTVLPIYKCLEKYKNDLSSFTSIQIKDRKDRGGNGKIIVTSLECYEKNTPEIKNRLYSGAEVTVKIGLKNMLNDSLKNVVFSFDIFDDNGNYVMMFRSNFENSNFTINPGRSEIIINIDDFPLVTGTYNTSIFISYNDTEVLDFVTNASQIDVDMGNYFKTESYGMPSHCKILHRSTWNLYNIDQLV